MAPCDEDEAAKEKKKKKRINNVPDANKSLLLSDEGDFFFFLPGQTTRGPTSGNGEERVRILIEVWRIFGSWPSGQNADV